MKLDENYRIETNKFQYTLIKEEGTGNINGKTGKETISTDSWYFPTLSLALKKYVNESLKESQSIKEVLEKIDQLNNKIEGIINEGN